MQEKRTIFINDPPKTFFSSICVNYVSVNFNLKNKNSKVKIAGPPYLHVHASTDWSIKPWVQLALRASLGQLRQFHFLVGIHFEYYLRQLPHLLQSKFWTSVAELTDTYSIHHWRIFRNTSIIKSSPLGWIWIHDRWILFTRSNWLSYQTMS